MILETIVTTRNEEGSTNVAPMGPVCEGTDLDRFELRPFQSATTCANLVARREGILHITDDVLLFVQAALNRLPGDIALRAGEMVDCEALANACRTCEFEVAHVDLTAPRASIQCRTVYARHLREFCGFNRARHLILEATILATRIDFVPLEEIRARISEYAPVIEKTGGERELAALELLIQVVNDAADVESRFPATRPLL